MYFSASNPPCQAESRLQRSSKLVEEKKICVNLYIGLVKSDSFSCKYKQEENVKNVFNQQYYFFSIVNYTRLLTTNILSYVLHSH